MGNRLSHLAVSAALVFLLSGCFEQHGIDLGSGGSDAGSRMSSVGASNSAGIGGAPASPGAIPRISRVTVDDDVGFAGNYGYRGFNSLDSIHFFARAYLPGSSLPAQGAQVEWYFVARGSKFAQKLQPDSAADASILTVRKSMGEGVIYATVDGGRLSSNQVLIYLTSSNGPGIGIGVASNNYSGGGSHGNGSGTGGTSGTSGSSGVSGVSGVRGTSGASGTSGVSGGSGLPSKGGSYTGGNGGSKIRVTLNDLTASGAFGSAGASNSRILGPSETSVKFVATSYALGSMTKVTGVKYTWYFQTNDSKTGQILILPVLADASPNDGSTFTYKPSYGMGSLFVIGNGMESNRIGILPPAPPTKGFIVIQPNFLGNYQHLMNFPVSQINKPISLSATFEKPDGSPLTITDKCMWSLSPGSAFSGAANPSDDRNYVLTPLAKGGQSLGLNCGKDLAPFFIELHVVDALDESQAMSKADIRLQFPGVSEPKSLANALPVRKGDQVSFTVTPLNILDHPVPPSWKSMTFLPYNSSVCSLSASQFDASKPNAGTGTITVNQDFTTGTVCGGKLWIDGLGWDIALQHVASTGLVKSVALNRGTIYLGSVATGQPSFPLQAQAMGANGPLAADVMAQNHISVQWQIMDGMPNVCVLDPEGHLSPGSAEGFCEIAAIADGVWSPVIQVVVSGIYGNQGAPASSIVVTDDNYNHDGVYHVGETAVFTAKPDNSASRCAWTYPGMHFAGASNAGYDLRLTVVGTPDGTNDHVTAYCGGMSKDFPVSVVAGAARDANGNTSCGISVSADPNLSATPNAAAGGYTFGPVQVAITGCEGQALAVAFAIDGSTSGSQTLSGASTQSVYLSASSLGQHQISATIHPAGMQQSTSNAISVNLVDGTVPSTDPVCPDGQVWNKILNCCADGPTARAQCQ